MRLPKPDSEFTISVILLLVMFGGPYVLWNWRDWRLQRQARSIQTAAEWYRAKYGFYPEKLPIPAPVDLPEGELFYQRNPDGSYKIWYGTTLGESTTYNSAAGRWDE